MRDLLPKPPELPRLRLITTFLRRLTQWNFLAMLPSLPLKPIRRWQRRCEHWFSARDYRLLLIGLPSIVAILLWIGMLNRILVWTPAWISDHYRPLYQAALAVRDFEKAKIIIERTLQEAANPSPELVFNLARCLNELGQDQEAAALISNLAPLDGHGYIPAHLVMAQSMAGSRDPSALQTAEKHLMRVLELEPGRTDLWIKAGQICMTMQEWEAAKKHFLNAVVASPEVALQLANIARIRGQTEELRAWAERADRYFESRNRVETKDSSVRLGWAQAKLLLGQFTNSLVILDMGIREIGTAPFRELASQVLAEWESMVSTQSPSDLSTRLSLVQRGLEYWPFNPELLRRLIAFSRIEGPQAETARARLRRILAEGSTVPTLHLLLGIDAWQHNQKAEAREHFDAAFKLAPQVPTMVNNMALVLALGDKPEPERALTMINGVLDHSPNNPVFRDTRGQILVKLGRWREALTDLEFSLPSNKESIRTHQALGSAYQGLGMSQMAKEHQLLADSLKRNSRR